MKHRLIEIAVLLVICAVAAVWLRGGHERTLNGDWKVDIDREMVDGIFAKIPDEARKKAVEELGKVTFTFTDKTIRMTAGDKNEEAGFSITRQVGDSWTVETRDKRGETNTAALTWTDSAHIVLVPSGNPMKFYLVRLP